MSKTLEIGGWDEAEIPIYLEGKWYDCKILCLTVWKVMKREEAY